jgi:hypothetical protein
MCEIIKNNFLVIIHTKQEQFKMKSSDILYEIGNFWVLKDKHKNKTTFTVMKNKLTHSESVDDVTYPDVSLAIARAKYLHSKA